MTFSHLYYSLLLSDCQGASKQIRPGLGGCYCIYFCVEIYRMKSLYDLYMKILCFYKILMYNKKSVFKLITRMQVYAEKGSAFHLFL